VPLYDYDCLDCGHRVEVMHGVHGTGPERCSNCGSERIRKAFAAPAVHFKGTGWAKKERRATATPGSSRAATADAQGGDGSDAIGHAADGAAAGADASSKGAGETAGKDASASTDAAAPAPATAASGAGTD
jgi:putative FmdB family regulatory protein